MKIRNQDKNGVKVRVHVHKNGTTTVQADCNCFGDYNRLHTNARCPILSKSLQYRKSMLPSHLDKLVHLYA